MFSTREKRSRAPRALLMVLSAGALLLVGCKTKEMKSTPFYEGIDVTYTGNPEDRVNIWPVAYQTARTACWDWVA